MPGAKLVMNLVFPFTTEMVVTAVVPSKMVTVPVVIFFFPVTGDVSVTVRVAFFPAFREV